MIVFNKQGRRTKEESSLIEKINEKLNSLSIEEAKPYRAKKFNSKSELEQFFSEITKSNISEPQIEPQKPQNMSSTIIDDDIKPEGFTDPLNQAEVNQRTYNQHDVSGVSTEDIPEPVFKNPIPESVTNPAASQTGIEGDAAPKSDKKEIRDSKLKSEGGKDGEKPKEGFANVTNEGLNQLDDKDKAIACEQLVDTVLETYQMLHTFAQNYAKFKETEIVELLQEDKIDPEMRIPVDEKGTQVTLLEFIQTYNAQTEEAVYYDEGFGQKVRPVMIRVFKKRGWGLNDEQYLMYMFGKDIATKGFLVYGMKKQMNFVVQQFVNMHTKTKEHIRQTVETVKPDTITNPTPTAEPKAATSSETAETVIEDAAFSEA